MPPGQTRPGGCKPQAKVEKGRSLPTNPFYTVKTAGLSPKRPLFNLEAHGEEKKKNKLTCEHTSFPFFLVVPSLPPHVSTEKAVLVKREIDLRFGLQRRLGRVGSPAGIQAHAVSLPARFFSGFSPACLLLVTRGHVLQASPIRCFFAGTGGQWAACGCPHSLRERLLGRWIYPKGRRPGCLDRAYTHKRTRRNTDTSQSFPWGKPTHASRCISQQNSVYCVRT